MSTFVIEINTDNAAFHEGHGSGVAEIGRILGKVMERLNRGDREFKTMDTNGNTVGRAYFR